MMHFYGRVETSILNPNIVMSGSQTQHPPAQRIYHIYC